MLNPAKRLLSLCVISTFTCCLANRECFYTGITDNIRRRTWEHENDVNPGFKRDYKVHRLVYYETFQYVNNAIAREKSIGMAAAKEDRSDRKRESYLGRPECRMVRGKAGPSLRER